MSTRTTLAVFIAASLDGYIAREDGDITWLTGRAGEGEDYGYGEFSAGIDRIVLGRRTFEKVLTFGAWPYGRTPVVVLSRSLRPEAMPRGLPDTVRVDAGGAAELAARLAAEGARKAYIDGGKTIQSFLEAGLVDELTITTIPVLLGAGIPLFGRLSSVVDLEHLRTRAWPNGFVQSTWVRGGARAAQ